jgi:hypothetical protein
VQATLVACAARLSAGEHAHAEFRWSARFSVNDWASPILTFVALGVYADLRIPPDPVRYRQARALATLAALAVNVIKI